MKIVKITGLILCLIYISTNCTKEEVGIPFKEEVETPFIIGDTSDNFTLATFNPAIEVGSPYSPDINGDGNPDLKFVNICGGSECRDQGNVVKMEILNPDIEYSANTYMNYPIIYMEGDTLYYSNKYTCWKHETMNFSCWKNYYLTYLWFRIRINESYLYGWFQISATEGLHYYILLHRYAIQKNELLNY